MRIYGLGTVEARIVSKVGFEVGAALTDLAVDSGDLIAKGQVLARLHSAEQQARVSQAEAAVEAASATARQDRGHDEKIYDRSTGCSICATAFWNTRKDRSHEGAFVA